MVQRDQSSETNARLTKEHAELSADVEELARTVEALSGEIEAELGSHRRARDEIAAAIPESLLSLYEQIRAQKAGVGAARLTGGTCEGCHTQLPAMEVERLRAEGGLQRCDNCRRILVVV